MAELLSVVYPDGFRDGVLLVPIVSDSIDTSPIVDYAASNGYSPKDEYHLTIIGSGGIVGKLLAQLEQLPTSERRALEARLNALIPSLGDVCLREGKYHHVTRMYAGDDTPETRESIIQEAEIEGIDDFYAAFSRMTGIELGTPFPHVTLFTKGASKNSERGIGIASMEAFIQMEHEAL